MGKTTIALFQLLWLRKGMLELLWQNQSIELTRKRPTTSCNGLLCNTIVLIVMAVVGTAICDGKVSIDRSPDGSISFEFTYLDLS